MRLLLTGAALLGVLGCGGSDGAKLFSGTGSQTGAGGSVSGGGSNASGGSSAGAGGTGVGTGGTDGGSGGSPNGGTSTATGGTLATGGVSSGGTGGTIGTGPDGCQLALWCHDGDHDQHGDPLDTQTVCISPGNDWTTTCDDCDDTDDKVHPGAACKTTAFSVAGGGQSFDYDCSGTETECGIFAKAATCAVAGVGKCNGAGYLPNPNRTATSGQNAYCGSTAYQNCISVGVPCVAQAVTMTAIPCQ